MRAPVFGWHLSGSRRNDRETSHWFCCSCEMVTELWISSPRKRLHHCHGHLRFPPVFAQAAPCRWSQRRVRRAVVLGGERGYRSGGSLKDCWQDQLWGAAPLRTVDKGSLSRTWRALSSRGQSLMHRAVPASILSVSNWEGLCCASVLLQHTLSLLSWGEASYDESFSFLCHCTEGSWLPTRQALGVGRPAWGLRNSPFSIHGSLLVVLGVCISQETLQRIIATYSMIPSIYSSEMAAAGLWW